MQYITKIFASGVLKQPSKSALEKYFENIRGFFQEYSVSLIRIFSNRYLNFKWTYTNIIHRLYKADIRAGQIELEKQYCAQVSATKYQQSPLLMGVVFQTFSTSLTSVLSAGKAQVRAQAKSRSNREVKFLCEMTVHLLPRVYCLYRYTDLRLRHICYREIWGSVFAYL